MRRFGMVLAAALWACWGLQARATISYQYVVADSSFNNVSNVSVASGATVTVNLYLQETVTGTDSSLIASENGLFGAGVFVTKSGTTGDSTVSSIAGNTATEPAGFQGPLSSGTTTTSAHLLESTSTSDTTGGPSGTTTGGNVSTVNGTTTTDVLLGTLTLKGGSVGSTTTYTVESYKNFSGGDGNTLTFTNIDDLDVTNTNPAYTGADNATFSFTVTVTPEPSSLLLCGLVVPGVGIGVWRRLRGRNSARATA
jgi:hypothetical protein